MALADVYLVFPPQVVSNFGRYYPSLPMLHGALRQAGIEPVQCDLNAQFLDDLLMGYRAAGEIEAVEQAQTVDEDPTSVSLRAARNAARRLRHRFFDEDGRRRSRPQPPLSVLEALSAPFYLNLEFDQLCNTSFWDRRELYNVLAYLQQQPLVTQITDKRALVGISVPMGTQLVWTMALSRLIKVRDPSAKIVLGGPSLTLLSDEAIKALFEAHPSIDAIVKHQGEFEFIQIAKAFLDGEWPARSASHTYYRGGSQSSNCSTTQTPKRLDGLPIGVYNENELKTFADPVISLRQAEGCYWGKCAYCDYIELYPKDGPRYRPRSVKMIVDEMEHYFVTSGLQNFCLITEALPPKVASLLADEIVDREIAVRWQSFVMIDPGFTLPVLRKMVLAGCDLLFVGVETTVDRVLQLVEKRATKQLTRLFFSSCKQAGVNLTINLIPDLPSTTAEEALAALQELKLWASDVQTVNIFPFEATKSSRIGRNPERYGLLVKSVAGQQAFAQAEFAENHLSVEDPAMSDAERSTVLAAYRSFSRDVDLRNDVCKRTASPHVLNLADTAEIVLSDKSTVGGWGFSASTGRLTELSSGWRALIQHLSIYRRVQMSDLARLLPALDILPSPDLMSLVRVRLEKADLV